MVHAIELLTAVARMPFAARALHADNRLLDPLLPLISPNPGAPRATTGPEQRRLRTVALNFLTVLTVCRTGNADNEPVLRERFCSALMVRLVMALDTALREAEAEETGTDAGHNGGFDSTSGLAVMQQGLGLLSVLTQESTTMYERLKKSLKHKLAIVAQRMTTHARQRFPDGDPWLDEVKELADLLCPRSGDSQASQSP